MSITNVTQINGFDAVQYNKLLEAAKSEYVSKAQVDQAILNAVNAGKSFSEALHTVNTTLPTLPPPIGKGMWDSGLAGLPSFGADYLALISDLAAEERRRSAEQRALQTEVIVGKINEQAAEMREKAVAQLCMGIATGVTGIAQGAAAFGMMAHGTKANAGLDDIAKKQTADMMLNTKVGSFNSAMGGVTGMLGSINQAVGGFYDADVKLMEADIERTRAQADALRSLEDSLKDVIQKALAAMDSIQQSTNQTRVKILG